MVEALAPVISIEAHGSAGNADAGRTLTIVSVTRAPSEAASDQSAAASETDDSVVDAVVETAGKTVSAVTEAASSLLGGK